MPKQNIFIGVTVTLITVIMKNLALAVIVGVIISALVFAYLKIVPFGVDRYKILFLSLWYKMDYKNMPNAKKNKASITNKLVAN